MRKIFRILWLVWLSIFPINDLLKNVEMEDFAGRKGK